MVTVTPVASVKVKEIMSQQSPVPAGLRIGVSTHDLGQVRAAILDGADYLGIGPTFPSSTKKFAAFPGLEFVREVATETTLPTFALGGINVQNVHEVVAAGGRRIAVSAAIARAADPASSARALCGILPPNPGN